MPQIEKPNNPDANNVISVRLSALIKKRRGRRTKHEVAREIGISPASVSSAENGRLPNLVRFAKICVWLKLDPAEILGISSTQSGMHSGSEATVHETSVHLYADLALAEGAAHDLAELIIFAHRELALRIRVGHVDPSVGF
jgi:transcriptional regulator with XRE-family HTH domain